MVLLDDLFYMIIKCFGNWSLDFSINSLIDSIINFKLKLLLARLKFFLDRPFTMPLGDLVPDVSLHSFAEGDTNPRMT